MNIFFEIWHWLWALFGCSLNLLLIYVAVFKTPKAIRPYATLIINFAITDFLECFLDWFTQLRLIPTPGDISLTYIANGPCQYINPFSCKLGISLLLHCLPHAVWSLLLSFGYRYYILHHSALSRMTLFKILLLIYIPSLFQGATYWTTLATKEQILPLANKWFPDYHIELGTGVITGIVDTTNWVAAYGISHICLPIFPVYTAIFIVRRKIIKHLEENTQMMSSDTRAAHAQLLKALTFQALVPAFLGVAVICYILSQTGLVVSPILEYAIFSSFILMPTLSPFTYLCFVRPYRQFFMRVIRRSMFLPTRPIESSTKAARFDSGGQVSHFTNTGTAIC
ncbi:hypothetical protein B9Z55_018553 [Caenorhabditis nigoni]|uniref:G-protein coupled receptors family 1 profile domain-containing protein n=1 Tax=Caenorhabditis nigoni TaxID=1611254 RepID=A0A2G5TEH9_9PELO|nr:hypothetical protein B9Z55_018553 [Caenorhabditis nigoni]